MAARAAVEALLRERKLDRTLTSTLPERLGDDAVAAFGTDTLDRALSGGLPRGQVSEVVGPASSGRTSFAWAALAAATLRGESVALIDTFDRFDPPTAHACGIELSRLLWVRGQAVSKTAVAIDPAWLPGVRAVSGPGTFMERVIDRAIKSLNLVVQSGVCTLVVLDLIDVPAVALRRLPASTWFRIERAIEGSDTAVVILSAIPVARSAGGRSIQLGGDQRVQWKGDHERTRRVAGVRSRASIAAARWSQVQCVDTETTVVNALVEAGR
jgi:recombination protein RecA